MTTTEQTYGTEHISAPWALDTIIGDIDVSHYGYAILRIGRFADRERTSWEQTSCVTLTPAECERLAADLLAIARR